MSNIVLHAHQPPTSRPMLPLLTRLPSASATSSAPRLASRREVCSLGLRSTPCRNNTTDGDAARRNANNVPKSVSAETSTLASCAARAKVWTVLHLPPNGTSWPHTVFLPNAAQLSGVQVALQAFYLPTSSPIGCDLSNAIWARIGF